MTDEQLVQEYPKIAILIKYIYANYPNDALAISKHPMIAQAAKMSSISNPGLERIVDNLAIFNGWIKNR